MIQLLYTNAGNANRKQPDPAVSLGGLISESIVPNDYPGALFSDITQFSKNETIVLGLISSVALSAMSFTIIDVFAGETGYKGAKDTMVLDDCQIYKTQQLPNNKSVPFSLPLANVRSTNAYLRLNIVTEPSTGDTFTLIDNATAVLSFDLTRTDSLDEINERINLISGYYSTKRYDFENKRHELLVFKENLANFNAPSVTLLNLLETASASVNTLDIGAMTANLPVALFLNRIVNTNSKDQDCERLYKIFKDGIERRKQYDYKLYFNYTVAQ